ncbi:hypothetical protein ACOSQ3_006091 [Xanthoceras sorbifolium]
MADVLKGGVVKCNDSCGCPVPCPGALACKCSSKTASRYDHKQCSCGEHCRCNPCSCGKNQATDTTGKGRCSCGTGCTCPTCAAA